MRRGDREDEARSREQRARATAPAQDAIPPRACTALDVIALQRTIGNHAVVALLNGGVPASRSATGSAVLARMTVTAPLSAGVFNNVTVSSRASTGYAQGQGSHTTAYVTFVDMIKLRVVGQTPAQAAQNLVDCYTELLTLPGAQIANANATFRRLEAFAATQAAVANPNRVTIETAIAKLLKARNAMPLSRTDSGSRTVRNESWHTWLMQMERRARSAARNQAAHQYYGARYDIFWEMFDFQPTTSVDNGEITDTIQQHILSMQATYEELFVQGDFTISGAAQHFANTPALWNRFVQKVTTTTVAYPSIAQKRLDIQNVLLSW